MVQPYGRGPLEIVKTQEAFLALYEPLETYAQTLPKDDAVCRLWLVRHGQSQGNKDKVNIGSGESPMTKAGKEQAYTLGKTLAKFGPEFSEVVCSSLSRTRETAEEIDKAWQEVKGKELPKPFQKMPELNERFCGIELQGPDVKEDFYQPFKEREKHDIESLINFEEKFEYQMRHADGRVVQDQDSHAKVYNRVIPALLALASKNKGRDILVNTHIGCMRAMIMGLASTGHTKSEKPVALELRRFDLPNGTCFVLESDGKEIRLKATTELVFKG